MRLYVYSINMGCFDIFCCMCGNYLDDKRIYDFDDFDESKAQVWLARLSMMLVTGAVVHNLTEVSCANTFEDEQGKEYFGSMGRDTIQNMNGKDRSKTSKGTNIIAVHKSVNGLFIHTDCWLYVKKKLGIELKYCDLPCIGKMYATDNNFKVSYGGIEKYWNQDFDIEGLINDKKMFMMESPLVNSKNAKRIDHVLNQLKIKKRDNRKSPNVSATFFNLGDIKLGNDYNFWVISHGKWMVHSKPVVKSIDVHIKIFNKKASSSLIEELNNLPYCCDTFRIDKKSKCLEPLFIHVPKPNYFPYQKNNIDETINFVLIGTEGSIHHVLKRFPEGSYEIK
jgi:hypothetical protein